MDEINYIRSDVLTLYVKAKGHEVDNYTGCVLRQTLEEVLFYTLCLNEQEVYKIETIPKGDIVGAIVVATQS
jgi:hypothetical protein